MKFTAAGDDGASIEFECADTITSRWVCEEILAGKTYPYLPFVDDVQVVFDVGANCGATSVHFARHYPDATVHSFEPGSEARAILERNAAGYANIRVHPIGLHSVDQAVPLYKGDGDTILGSVIHRKVNLDESEPVQLRAAGTWTAQQGIDHIDVLKVDVEGVEVEVLESLAHLLPTVKVLYVEYDSRAVAARRRPAGRAHPRALYRHPVPRPGRVHLSSARRRRPPRRDRASAPHARDRAPRPAGDMRLTTPGDDGAPIEFECADTMVSRWISRDILAGTTYPYLPFAGDVRVVFDVGANCGATTVHFARHYPDADIHSFEPGSEPRAILERNAAHYKNVHVHPIGLHSADEAVPLYKGDGDTGLGSVFRREQNLAESEPVELRAAGPWAAEHGIERIDVLKIDVEGLEVDVLRSLSSLIPTVKVLYFEYDSRAARRDIDLLLEETHELYKGLVFLDQGECIYVRKDLAALDAANEHLLELIRIHWTAHGMRS